MNRGELVSAIKSYLNRPNLADADVATMIASVEGELNRELREHPRNARRTGYTIPINDVSGNPYTEDTPILPLPVDIATLVTLKDENGVRYEGYPATMEPDCGYVERGDCLHVYPTPKRGTTFYLDYIAFLDPLQAAADTNWVSDYFSDLYLYGALKEAAVYLKNDQRLALWQQEFMRRLDGVQHQGWNQNIGSSPRVRNA